MANSQKITASEAFVEALVAEDVDIVFGLVGSAFMDPLDLFPAAGIRFIPVRHEQNAALMAEGYARASGKIGVCVGQNGPGVTNLVTGVAAAYLNHTPVVVITPSVTSASEGRRAIQEIDQMPLFAPIVNDQIRLNRPDRMSWAMHNVFRSAATLRGPAQIDIPRDFWYGEFEEVPLTREAYRVERAGTGAARADVAKAAEVLRNAKNPVILAGLGVVEADASADVAALAERLGAPVAAVYLHNDAFPASHELSVGPIGYQGSKAAMRLISEADVVLALGTRLNEFGTIAQYDFDYFPQNAKLIHNEIDPLNLGRLRAIEVGLVGDAGAVVGQLLEAIPHGPDVQIVADRRARIAAEKKKWVEELRALSASDDADPIDPRRALREVTSALPADSVVATDVGNVCGTANGYLEFESGRRFLSAGTLGGIGVAYSTALGAKLACPDKPVLSFSGDGAWSMTIQETMTAVTENIPVVAVVFDNAIYGAEQRNQVDYFDRRLFFTNLDNPDFAQIARDMGAVGISVNEPSAIAPAITEAIESERPAVVQIRVNGDKLSEPYRRDAFRFPTRYLPKYGGAAPHA
ncbi:sulfoacetaldehyde acetyltransferase [Amycolatopsis jejuensis]|uniref:sulfoacetaldehyde acetyltransferase n=1 Tax=Amycolatopsis jejuensis TaxID=330084 RepID=UPI000526459D|nr:sulfoacetaldehyde acetyltransferase [Amycolatopsis jejuensis]